MAAIVEEATAPKTHERRLVGFDNFVRHNPLSDKFQIERFSYMEFYTSDATNASRRFTWGLGMPLVAKSDLSTGNKKYASYCIKSEEATFVFTAPYNNITEETTAASGSSSEPHPGFNSQEANAFVTAHGLAVRAICFRVQCAQIAFETAMRNNAVAVLAPVLLTDRLTGQHQTIAEVKWVDDVVMRFVSGNYTGPCLPNYELVNPTAPATAGAQLPLTAVHSNSDLFRGLTLGINRIDHAVTNVPKLFDTVDYITGFTGFHEFGEFTAADVGTVDSGLNSMVLANNNEFILLPVNEPTFGTRRKSQIQTFLEHNNGAGIQHIALKTDNIFRTVGEMRRRELCGGFEFMPSPAHEYYERIEARTGLKFEEEKLREIESLGLLVDKDDQGTLLQIFTKPLGDRTTVFIEIIERIGCDIDEAGLKKEQAAGCGGFGKGNFGELFKSIEEFEKQQEEAALSATTSNNSTAAASSEA